MRSLARRAAPAVLAVAVVVVPVPHADQFVAVGSTPVSGATAFLNDGIAIDFTNPVDLATANLNTVTFQVFDAQGTPLAERPSGAFRLDRGPGDRGPGRRLVFDPTFPSNNSYNNGGFRPGRIYLVHLPAGGSRAAQVLRDVQGRALARAFTFVFATPAGTTPVQLFRNPKPGGPARAGFAVTSAADDVSGRQALLNKRGQTPVVVTLRFDQALNPHTDNLPTALDLDPRVRSIGNRGRIFLEYDDTDPTIGRNVWLPARVFLVRNDRNGAELELHPAGVLPNNATIRVIVESTVEDISGESNVPSPSYDRVFATFDTAQAFEPQFDAIVESFDSTELFDLEAPILEPLPEIGPGFVRANFDFEGAATILDYRPMTPQVILNTDFTQITPVGAPPISVAGGVFQFRNVTIPAGVTVRGTGSNPMVWLITGDLTVDGTLCVDGGDGQSVFTLSSAHFPATGGPGVCGGGRGGRGSPNTSGQSPTGETGFGPGQVADVGGGGGNLGLTPGCGRGSGGGGGSFSTQGDPYYPVKSPGGTLFAQQTGSGGWGCLGSSGSPSRSLPPGAAGAVGFVDAQADNDFWGTAVDVNRGLRITGELSAPRGGSGGGGGGDRAQQLGSTAWMSNNKGAGGGGGGGVLIIKVLGNISIGASGRITANGGHGGGGEQAGGNNQGGGGGGGSGGMVVVMTAGKLRIVTHGETFARGDYDFAISADGGVGVQGAFGGLAWSDKYPPPGSPADWDANPAGGFGGLGVVQLMTPAGDDGIDNTGTVLDDNIEIVRGGTVLVGAEKQRYLAWRGFPDDSGVWVDDAGLPTYNNPPTTPGYPLWASSPDDEGDIRPAPVLMPAPFGHKSRIRSRWIDTGIGSVRLPVQQYGASGPRRIIEDPANNLLAGPRYEFAGTNADATGPKRTWLGYIDYDQVAGGIALVFPEIVLPGTTPPDITKINPNATFQGQPAYRLTLAQAVLGGVVDRYAQHQARLVDGSGVVRGSYRILGHDDQHLWLSPDQGLLPPPADLMRLRIVRQSFEVRTNGSAGLGPTYASGARQVPVANVQFGFAFHKDPSVPALLGVDPNRLPNDPSQFIYTLGDPAVQEQVRTFRGGAPFIMWDVLINTRFSEDEPDNTRAASVFGPSSPRPEIWWVLVPYRF